MVTNVNTQSAHIRNPDSGITAASKVEPFSFRLPKAGSVDPYFGGTRSFWNAHVLPSEQNKFKPQVQSVVRRQPGTKRGIRFIIYDSAKAFFQTLLDQQAAPAPIGKVA